MNIPPRAEPARSPRTTTPRTSLLTCPLSFRHIIVLAVMSVTRKTGMANLMSKKNTINGRATNALPNPEKPLIRWAAKMMIPAMAIRATSTLKQALSNYII